MQVLFPAMLIHALHAGLVNAQIVHTRVGMYGGNFIIDILTGTTVGRAMSLLADVETRRSSINLPDLIAQLDDEFGAA